MYILCIYKAWFALRTQNWKARVMQLSLFQSLLTQECSTMLRKLCVHFVAGVLECTCVYMYITIQYAVVVMYHEIYLFSILFSLSVHVIGPVY